MKSKVIVSVVITALIALVYRIAAPWAVMQSENVVVDQMKNTDASTAAVHYVGNGSGLLASACAIVWAIFMAVIWLKTIVKALQANDDQQ